MLVRIKYQPETASGRREGWARSFFAIDKTEKGAKAFRGVYLPKNEEIELEVGTLILEVSPEGSVKNSWQSARILKVNKYGSLSIQTENFNWRESFLSLRDEAERLLQQDNPDVARQDVFRACNDLADQIQEHLDTHGSDSSLEKILLALSEVI